MVFLSRAVAPRLPYPVCRKKRRANSATRSCSSTAGFSQCTNKPGSPYPVAGKNTASFCGYAHALGQYGSRWGWAIPQHAPPRALGGQLCQDVVQHAGGREQTLWGKPRLSEWFRRKIHCPKRFSDKGSPEPEPEPLPWASTPTTPPNSHLPVTDRAGGAVGHPHPY